MAYPPHMTLTLVLLGVLGFAVVVFGGFDAHHRRMRENPPGNGFFTIPEHQGRSLSVTIVGAFISIVSLLLSLSARRTPRGTAMSRRPPGPLMRRRLP